MRIIIQFSGLYADYRILKDLREFSMQLPGDKERTPVDILCDRRQIISVEPSSDVGKTLCLMLSSYKSYRIPR